MSPLGGRERKTHGKAKPMILSTSNNFSRIMHPFAVDKEWFKGFDNKDIKNIDGSVSNHELYNIMCFVMQIIVTVVKHIIVSSKALTLKCIV